MANQSDIRVTEPVMKYLRAHFVDVTEEESVHNYFVFSVLSQTGERRVFKVHRDCAVITDYLPEYLEKCRVADQLESASAELQAPL